MICVIFVAVSSSYVVQNIVTVTKLAVIVAVIIVAYLKILQFLNGLL